MFDILAWAGLLGFSPEAMIEGDRLGYRLRLGGVQRAIEIRDRLDDTLALKIVNRLAESLNHGKGSS